MKTNAKREGDSGMHKVLIISEGVLKRYKWLRLSAGSSGRPIALPWSLSPATPRNARSGHGPIATALFRLGVIVGEPCGSRWGPETAPLCTRRSHHMADVRGVESRCGTGNAQARLASATVADGRRNSLPKVITAIAPTWPASFGTQQQVQPNC